MTESSLHPHEAIPARRLWRRLVHPALLLLWVFVLGCFFAMVEIHIEGGSGWATSLPTWRVEEHWLLDVFWGGRPLTGYHAWVFSFMALVFHLHFFVRGNWTLKLEGRTLGCIMVFWIVEDWMWFVLNPHFGAHALKPGLVEWHKSWFLGVPTDYWTFMAVGLALFAYSFWPARRRVPPNEPGKA